MKRWICLCFALLMLLSLAACTSGVETLYTEETIGGDQPTLEQGKQLSSEELTEVLKGLTPDEMRARWGEPDGTLSGMWGEIWDTDDGNWIIVYYDAEGHVEYVKNHTPEEGITDEVLQTEQKAVWGLTFEVKDVTPTGLTIVCTQSGGEPTGELQTGSYYFIEKKEGDRWGGMEYTEIEEDQVGWTAEAWIIAPDNTLEWEVDWSWLYGELPAGEYRIGKSVMDWRETGDYDEAGIYAEFRIE